MNLLITNMLDLSKLESETIGLHLESFNIVRLLRGMVKKLSLEFKNKDLHVKFDLPSYAYVEGDVRTLERVVQNLLSNTIKYTPAGNDIIISVKEEEINYLISIENKGIKIPEKELENVFAKFYRLDKSGDRTKNSYGLGLALSLIHIFPLYVFKSLLGTTLESCLFLKSKYSLSFLNNGSKKLSSISFSLIEFNFLISSLELIISLFSDKIAAPNAT